MQIIENLYLNIIFLYSLDQKNKKDSTYYGGKNTQENIQIGVYNAVFLNWEFVLSGIRETSKIYVMSPLQSINFTP